MRYARYALAVIFAFLAVTALAQAVFVFSRPSDDPRVVAALQALVGILAAAAAVGTWIAARWAPAAAAAYGVVTAAMIVGLGPLLDLDSAARRGLWLGGIVVLTFGLVSAWFLRRGESIKR